MSSIDLREACQAFYDGPKDWQRYLADSWMSTVALSGAGGPAIRQSRSGCGNGWKGGSPGATAHAGAF